MARCRSGGRRTTCAATRGGFSTSAMSARRWCRGCLASSRACSRSASRACCATSRCSPPEVASATSRRSARLMSRTFAEDETALRQGDQLRQRDRARARAAAASARSSCSRRRATISPASSPARISVKELRMLAREPRRNGSPARVPATGPAHSDAELAAHRLGVRDDRARSSGRARWPTAASPGPTSTACWPTCPRRCARAADHFGFAADDGQLAAIAAGPLMSRYSKALEYEYSAGLRRELIAEADRATAANRRARLPCSRSAAEKSPLLARALSRAEGLNVPGSADPDRRRGRRMPQDRGVGAVRRRPHHQSAQHDQAERATARRERLSEKLAAAAQGARPERGIPRIRLPGDDRAAADHPLQARHELRRARRRRASSSCRARPSAAICSCTHLPQRPQGL